MKPYRSAPYDMGYYPPPQFTASPRTRFEGGRPNYYRNENDFPAQQRMGPRFSRGNQFGMGSVYRGQ